MQEVKEGSSGTRLLHVGYRTSEKQLKALNIVWKEMASYSDIFYICLHDPFDRPEVSSNWCWAIVPSMGSSPEHTAFWNNDRLGTLKKWERKCGRLFLQRWLLQQYLPCLVFFCNVTSTLPHQERASVCPPLESWQGRGLWPIKYGRNHVVLAPGVALYLPSILCFLPLGTLVSQSPHWSHTEKLLAGHWESQTEFTAELPITWGSRLGHPAQVSLCMTPVPMSSVPSLIKDLNKETPRWIQATHSTVRNNTTLLLTH